MRRLDHWWRWAAVLAPAAALYFFALPGLNQAQGRLLGIFAGTIIALVAQPMPMGACVLLSLTVLALTRTLPAEKIFSGFANPTVWLIFTAFLFSRAVTATGFGMRVAYHFIRRFARSPLSLAYSIAAADLVLAPFIPSDTARGGALVFPIARSVSSAFGSEPGPTARRIGAFLMLASFHVNIVASAMFLTSMASNPLIAGFARKVGHVELTWMRWISGSVVPGLLTLAIVPWLLYRWVAPEVREMKEARELAGSELARMGPLSRNEKWLLVILVGVMAGWVTYSWHGISNTFIALAGVSGILLAGVLKWEDLLREHRAWDALVWFAPILMMADALGDAGVIKALSGRLVGITSGLTWPLALVLLVIAYLYVHYSFASMTAQATALYPTFLGAAIAGGVPPLMAALPLGYFSSLNAALTHYGTGSAPVFFEAGYVRQGEWWRVGFRISLVILAIWLGVGAVWWKVVGIW
jgi:DASS family divalent anion:Na+ symporter